MPSNTSDYQKSYRKRTANKRQVVSVSMPPADYSEIQRYAKAQGLSVSALLREATLHQTRGSALRAQSVEGELKELKFLLANIANNINQMAHHSNVVRHVADEGAALARLQELGEIIERFVDDKTKPR
jgi:hypothetical protein